MEKTSLQPLALLRTNQEKLIQDWLALSGVDQRNHIDEFFKNLDSPSLEGELSIPDGFSLRELIHHYHLLRNVIFDFLEDKKEINPYTRKYLNEKIDVAIRAASENFLNELEAKNLEIKDILNSINDGFFMLDKNYIITQVNEQHVKISRVPRNEQIGKNFFDVFPGAKNPQSKYFQSYTKTMNERVSLSFEDYYEPLDIWTKVNVIPKNDGGIAAFFSEITAQKKTLHLLESEKLKLESLFLDSSAALALLRGDNFTFEKINPKYANLFRGRALIGKPLIEALPELKSTTLPQIMTEVYKTGTPFIGIELLVPLIREVGGPLVDSFFDFTYSRINDINGNSYGIYIHAVDVTEKVNARKAIEKALSSRDEFLTIASHELKTPLTSLKLQLQLAQRRILMGAEKDFTPANLLELFENNVSQVNRLIRLVEDMLDISRIESGKLSFHFAETDLSELVKEVYHRFKDTFQNQSAKFSLVCEDGIWALIDKERIEQVILNLITNAVKYGNGSPIELSLRSNDQKLELSVTDKGRGIANKDHQRIFERFERLVSAHEISGLGIGLYISKQIVEAHKGQILLESIPSLGSTFTMILPRLNK